jgi:hypothetical protein
MYRPSLEQLEDRDTPSVLSVGNVNAAEGSLVLVPVNVDSVSQLAAASLAITYDPKVLEFVRVGTGTLNPTWLVSGTPSFNGGQLGVAEISRNANTQQVSGGGSLATLTFEVIGPPGQTAVSIVSQVTPINVTVPTALVGAGLQPLPFTLAGPGIVAIAIGGSGPASPQLPPAPPAPVSYPASGKLGNIQGDGMPDGGLSPYYGSRLLLVSPEI